MVMILAVVGKFLNDLFQQRRNEITKICNQDSTGCSIGVTFGSDQILKFRLKVFQAAKKSPGNRRGIIQLDLYACQWSDSLYEHQIAFCTSLGPIEKEFETLG